MTSRRLRTDRFSVGYKIQSSYNSGYTLGKKEGIEQGKKLERERLVNDIIAEKSILKIYPEFKENIKLEGRREVLEEIESIRVPCRYGSTVWFEIKFEDFEALKKKVVK